MDRTRSRLPAAWPPTASLQPGPPPQAPSRTGSSIEACVSFGPANIFIAQSRSLSHEQLWWRPRSDGQGRSRIGAPTPRGTHREIFENRRQLSCKAVLFRYQLKK